MGEILGVGLTHYPPFIAPDEDRAIPLRRTLARDERVPADMKDWAEQCMFDQGVPALGETWCPGLMIADFGCADNAEIVARGARRVASSRDNGLAPAHAVATAAVALEGRRAPAGKSRQPKCAAAHQSPRHRVSPVPDRPLYR